MAGAWIGAGLTPGGEAWRKAAHRRFLVPGHGLSEIFRAKIRDGLQREDLLAGLDPGSSASPGPSTSSTPATATTPPSTCRATSIASP